MPAVYAIHLVQQFADGCPYGICLCNEFLIVTYVLVKVIEEFLGMSTLTFGMVSPCMIYLWKTNRYR
ncbi:MAG: hypothetical protein SCH66_12390 [Methanolobus sp.]|nr:hypothetical protein [Methanolobus sp.]